MIKQTKSEVVRQKLLDNMSPQLQSEVCTEMSPGSIGEAVQAALVLILKVAGMHSDSSIEPGHLAHQLHGCACFLESQERDCACPKLNNKVIAGRP